MSSTLSQDVGLNGEGDVDAIVDIVRGPPIFVEASRPMVKGEVDDGSTSTATSSSTMAVEVKVGVKLDSTMAVEVKVGVKLDSTMAVEVKVDGHGRCA